MNNSTYATSADRFIPLRGSTFESFKVSHTYSSPNFVSCNEYCQGNTTEQGGINFMQDHYKNNIYQNALIDCMFGNTRRALYFSPKQKSIKSEESKIVEDWPVKVRKNPLITKPSLILDMLEIDMNFNGSNQKVDWGSNGFIAALTSHKIYAINPDTNCTMCIKADKNDLGSCIKWNTQGNRLAISLKNRSVTFWDSGVEKVVSSLQVRAEFKQISYIAYTTRLIILAFTSGAIQVWTQNPERVIGSVFDAHVGAIIIAKISCNECYLATSGVDGNVRIWDLPTCRKMCQIDCTPCIILALSWHPWREPLLVIGECSENSFCILVNINIPKTIMAGVHPNVPIVDCLSFNPISAELVISFWLEKPLPNQRSQHVVVQSGVTTVVDDINFHTTRTPYLLWDPRGERLASIGTDETLAIWDFLGLDNKRRVAKKLFQEDSCFATSTIR